MTLSELHRRERPGSPPPRTYTLPLTPCRGLPTQLCRSTDTDTNTTSNPTPPMQTHP